MIIYVSKVSFPYYYPNLGKCVILGICSIFSNKFCQDNLEQTREFKIHARNLNEDREEENKITDKGETANEEEED